MVCCSPLQANLCTSHLVHWGLLCTHLWKERPGRLSWHSVRWFLCLVVEGGWILGFTGSATVLRIRQRVVLAISLTPACSNICLLVKSDCFTASHLMADIWRLDIFRFTPLSHLFRVWLTLVMNLFTVLWSRHNSFAISVDFPPFPLQWDLSACPSLAL